MIDFVKYSNQLESKIIGKGNNGRAYLTSDGEVFKKFDDSSLYINDIFDLVKIKNNTFVFPKKLVSLNNIIIGYIMEYIEGLELQYISKKISLKDYLDALVIAEYDISYLSQCGIYSFDLMSRNVMITPNNRFKVIDTDFYKKTGKNKKLYSHNISNFSLVALEPILNPFSSRFNDSKLESEKIKIHYGRMLPSKFIIILLKYMHINNIDNISIGDLSKELKLLYKQRE